MLNSDSLGQLKALKSQLSSQAEAALKEGAVRGSQGRFGFVACDDGTSFFLTPDEMAKVLPGDRIQFSEITDDNGKVQAVVEKLITTTFKRFTGRFQKRGKGQFVVPDVNMMNHWLYLPPEACTDIKEDDWLVCEVARHPFPSGKPQAKVIKNLGQLSDAGFERNYSLEKFALSHEWPDTMNSELALLAEESIPAMAANYNDLTALPFVTIDNEHTRDMDDALCAQATENGFKLSIAIADPSAWFGMNTSLDQEAARRSNSLYFPGRSLPMLPQELSNGLCSLLEDKNRLALVCHLSIAQDGKIEHYEFEQALVCSKGKLNYPQVSEFLAGDDSQLSAELAPHLKTLHSCTNLLNQYRQAHNLIMEDRPDYYLNVNDAGKVLSIVRADRNSAQKLVEEAMLAANISCARYLQTIGQGIYVQHAGFRTERIGDVKTIIEQQNIPFEGDFTSAEGYKKLIQTIIATPLERPIRSLLSRFLTRSEFSLTAAPHVGMGFDCYTTFTSPIRKYNDLVIHRVIKAHLNNIKAPDVTQDMIDTLQKGLFNGRNAVNQAELWLKLQYLEQFTQVHHEATISQVNPGGFIVTLDAFGVDGFVDLRKNKAKLQFDKTYLCHANEQTRYELDQKVKVKIKSIDLLQRKLELEFVPA